MHLADDSLSLAEADLAYSNDWFIRLRWIAGVGVLAGALFVTTIPKTGIPAAPLWIIGASILLYNLIFFLVARGIRTTSGKPGAYRRLAYAQMILDWLAITLLVQFTGGIDSPLTFFYVFHVVIACMFFPPKTSFAFTFLAIALFTTIIVLEYFSILPHYPIIAWRNYRIYVYQDPLYVTTLWSSFSLTLIILTYLASGRSERLRQREAEVLALSETLKLNSAKLQALNDSARTVNSTLELGQVLNQLVTNTAHVMRVRACSIRLLDKSGKQLEPVAVYGLSQEYQDKGPIELENSPLDRKVLEGKVINIPDVRQSSLLQYPDWALQEGICSMVSAPLMGKSRPLGILRAYADDRDRFTPDDEAFLSAIAAQGSIAIENALAYQTIETLDATKGAFIRVFTHELRSPVSVIRSLLQTVLSAIPARSTRSSATSWSGPSAGWTFLRKLIDDLLDLANGRAPQASANLETPLPLDEVVENVVKRFELPAREKGLILEWHGPGGRKPGVGHGGKPGPHLQQPGVERGKIHPSGREGMRLAKPHGQGSAGRGDGYRHRHPG